MILARDGLRSVLVVSTSQIGVRTELGGRSGAKSPPVIWGASSVTRDDLIAALREAFDAGVSHGEDSATAYEHGSRSRYTRDQMFEDCIAQYNGPDSPIQKLLSALSAPQHTVSPEADGGS